MGTAAPKVLVFFHFTPISGKYLTPVKFYARIFGQKRKILPKKKDLLRKSA